MYTLCYVTFPCKAKTLPRKGAPALENTWLSAGAQQTAVARAVAPTELQILLLQYTAEQTLRSEAGKSTILLTCDSAHDSACGSVGAGNKVQCTLSMLNLGQS